MGKGEMRMAHSERNIYESRGGVRQDWGMAHAYRHPQCHAAFFKTDPYLQGEERACFKDCYKKVKGLGVLAKDDKILVEAAIAFMVCDPGPNMNDLTGLAAASTTPSARAGQGKRPRAALEAVAAA